MSRPGLTRYLLAAGATTLLGACSSQQLYATGQQWQKSECRKIEDRAERSRCERSSETSYDSYKVQTEAARKP